MLRNSIEGLTLVLLLFPITDPFVLFKGVTIIFSTRMAVFSYPDVID